MDPTPSRLLLQGEVREDIGSSSRDRDGCFGVITHVQTRFGDEKRTDKIP
jgi:hypothetical protein